MSPKRRRAADDLTRINGIGTGSAAFLNELGIRTFDQLARTPIDQIVKRSKGQQRISAARIRKERWLEQAARLAGVSTPDPNPAGEASPLPQRVRHTFTLEMQTDGATNKVVASKVVHVETHDSDTWQGWNPSRLTGFIEARSTPPAGPIPEPPPTPGPSASSGSEPADVHRFGVVEGVGSLSGSSRVQARLQLDPAELDLPARQAAAARVDLFARAAARGGAVLVESKQVDLEQREPLHVALEGLLPDSELPFTLFAAVRILVERVEGRPGSDLGNVNLELLGEGRTSAALDLGSSPDPQSE